MKMEFFNRELSWLEFNERVLQEAFNKANPLYERAKFLSISSSNLDEFFMVRVASLGDQVKAGFDKKDPAGLTAEEQLIKISERVHIMMEDIYSCYNNLLSSMKKENVIYKNEKDLNKTEVEFLKSYFENEIYPVLTPMVVDSSRPFPLILNKSLNIASILENEDKQTFATIQVPSVLDRIVNLPSKEKEGFNYILLEDIIKMFMDKLYIGYKITNTYCYKITRNADLSIDEEEAEDLLTEIEQSLKLRKWGSVVRLELEENFNESLRQILVNELDIKEEDIYISKGALNPSYMMKLGSYDKRKEFNFDKFKPIYHKALKSKNLFKAIKKGDILLHHPYESFDPVIELVKKAAKDPNVLAIKQTLYRVSGNSPIVAALAEAAENGKQVTVLLEIKARFDEENNIIWGKRLEKSGCHVIYGLVGLKTHSKILLIVRKEEDGIKRYVHLGTGNYNDVTAKLYTDMGLLTCKPQFGSDASAIFNMLSGYSKLFKLHKIDVAPLTLRNKFYTLIEREMKYANEGKKAHIIAKMNSLTDEEMIKKLYEANKTGVKIDLIIRGVCCLKPGIVGMSENITVRSIIGRFLEHSRIFYFYNNGKEDMYLTSADWMRRNLTRRVELMFPIESKDNKAKLKNYLEVFLNDNVKVRILRPDGKYYNSDEVACDSLAEPLNSQEYFQKLALKLNS
ncbi:RNA degradosome polyphosphate kinase [Clostridium sp. DL1XJH146]